MRVTVYKMKTRPETGNLLNYDLNDPAVAEVVWQSCSDESENEDYPSVDVGVLSIIAEHETGDLFLISEIPEVIRKLKLQDKADAYSKWWPKDMKAEDKEEAYYLLDNLKAAQSLFQEVYGFFKEEDGDSLLKLWI